MAGKQPQRRRRSSKVIELTGTYGPGTTAVEDFEGWHVEVYLVEAKGRLVVKRLRIEPSQEKSLPPQGLTGRDLRRIKLGAMVTRIGRLQDSFQKRGESLFLPDETRRLKKGAAIRQGRAREDSWYAQIAEEYLVELKRNPRRPVAALSERYLKKGMETATPANVRDWVRLARDYGWLTRGRRGFAGGEATEKLKRLRRAKRRQ